MRMDNLIAIGVGLGLRALIDSVAQPTYIASALVGLWEGVVLNHFIAKFPSSIDPYLALGFRLFVDYLFTESVTRELITVLWTGLGMLLADVGLQLSSDYRFRQLWRRTQQKLPLPAMRQSSRSLPPRVRFYEDPDSQSTSGSGTTVASSPVVPVRPTTTPVPGQFDQWSAKTPSTMTEQSPPPSDVPSPAPSDSGNDAPDVPPRPRTPSELEYISLPVIPDAHSTGQPSAGPSVPPTSRPPSRPPTGASFPTIPDDISPLGDEPPAPGSGLTTPTTDPMALTRDPDDPNDVHSGLTTPERPSPLQLDTSRLPPVVVKDAPSDKKRAAGGSVPPRLMLVNPSPTVDFPEPQTTVPFPEPQLTPMPIPPVSEIPNIPTPDDRDAPTRDDENRTPPPTFQEAMKDVEPPQAPDEQESVIDQESVISDADKLAVINKADEIRKKAKEQEKERDRVRKEWRKAEREGRYFDAIVLEQECQDAQAKVDQLHAKAARRYYHG